MAVSAGGRTAHGVERLRGAFFQVADRPVVTVFALALFVRVVAAVVANLFADENSQGNEQHDADEIHP